MTRLVKKESKTPFEIKVGTDSIISYLVSNTHRDTDHVNFDNQVIKLAATNITRDGIMKILLPLHALIQDSNHTSSS